jgi:large subunit ribosomal protein L21
VYAVIKTGGKQYRVEEGRAIKVDRLTGEPGDTVELGEVLLLANGDDITIGAPFVEGARVVGTIAEQGRSRKIVVFRYKNKTRHRKKTGHRQHFTRVLVSDILAKGERPKERPQPVAKAEPAAPAAEAPAPPAPKKRRARPGTAEAVREVYAEAAAAEAAAEEAKKRGRRKAEPSGGEQPAAEETAAEEKPKRSRKKSEE